MALRVVIFGAGRVGTAFGQRLVANRVDVLGFVGRDAGRTARAIQWVGDGSVPAVQASAHPQAHVVLFAVGDDDLRAAIEGAVRAAPPRPCSLWLHTSGRHGLEVFDGVPGIRRGALHPVAPFANGPVASRTMVGAPAVVVGDPAAERLLRQLCRRLDLVPIAARAGDRVLYHAACALAANGLTALFAASLDAFAASGVVTADAAQQLAVALMRAAIDGCSRDPVSALTGPVRRGDAATVAAHVRALREHASGALPVYLATARLALGLAEKAGLDPARARALRELLGP